MTSAAHYKPGPAYGATISKDGDKTWSLVVVRELRHTPDKVWEALTDPAQLRAWAPFDADGNLGIAGASVKLTTVGAPKLHVTETKVTLAERPRTLVYNWGGNDMRWTLEPRGSGTRLTLWTSINRHFIAMGAAGWHVCFDVLDHHIAGTPLGRTVGPDALKVEGWDRLHADYARAFGLEEAK